MSKHPDSEYRVHNGFLSRVATAAERAAWSRQDRALDARRSRDDEPDEDDPDEIEIHNHLPMREPDDYAASYRSGVGEQDNFYDRARDDEEEPNAVREGEPVARFPVNGFSAITEGDEIVVYRTTGPGDRPQHKTDIHEMDSRSRTSDQRSRGPRPPRTLRELNEANAAHYKKMGGRR
jgi:hypothetical protein